MSNRREFISLLGGAAASWPLAASAQQPAMPVIGFLSPVSPGEAIRSRLAAFRQALAEIGYVEGRNVAIEYRWAEGRFDLFPELAADLVRRNVSVIVTPGAELGARAAQAATTTIPIVFGVSEDPVKMGLVASLARPGGNATGINFLSSELVAKRVGVLRELLPGITRLGVLINPNDSSRAESVVNEVRTAASSLGQQVHVRKAGTSDEIDESFVAFAHERIDVLFVGPDPFFNSRRVQLALMAVRHMVPAIYGNREYVEAGGLMSYGPNLVDMFREAGAYTGKILRGAKPADLPVVQSSKFELLINRQAAKALGLTIPDKLLAAADEVIE
jgi:putative tryptophan/tyrosine transport system substrate-binding protein